MKITRRSLRRRSTVAWTQFFLAITVFAGELAAADTNRVEMLVVNTGDEFATVRRYDAASGTYLGLHWANLDGAFGEPRGFARLGPDGDLLVTARGIDSSGLPVIDGDAVVLGIDPDTGSSRRLFDLPSDSVAGSPSPQALRRGPDGTVYVAVAQPAGEVHRYEPDGGGLIDRIVLNNPTSATPLALRFRDDGQLLVLTGNHEVRLIDPQTGEDRGPLVPSGAGGLEAAAGADLVIGPDGLLYVSSTGTNRVLRYDLNTGMPLGEFAVPPLPASWMSPPVLLSAHWMVTCTWSAPLPTGSCVLMAQAANSKLFMCDQGLPMAA